MKVTLISPYPDIKSFGIRTLSACLKREGHDVQLIFLLRPFTKRYEDKTLDEVVKISSGAALVGISLMTNFFDNAVQLTQRLRKGLDVPILWGGIHPTIRPQECLDYADMVCIGEGEEAVTELVRKMEGGQGYHDVHGIWSRENGNITTNKMRPLIRDLDSIPFPDYDYETHYVLDGNDIRTMDEGLFKKHTLGVYTAMPSRGCPFGCSYCCNNTLNKMYPGQNPLRKRSVNNIIEELMQVKVRLPTIRRVLFEDDAFLIYSAEEIGEFSEKYKENIELPLFITGATP